MSEDHKLARVHKYTTGAGEETETLMVGPCAVRFEDDFYEMARLINLAITALLQSERAKVVQKMAEALCGVNPHTFRPCFKHTTYINHMCPICKYAAVRALPRRRSEFP